MKTNRSYCCLHHFDYRAEVMHNIVKCLYRNDLLMKTSTHIFRNYDIYKIALTTSDPLTENHNHCTTELSEFSQYIPNPYVVGTPYINSIITTQIAVALCILFCELLLI